MWSSSQEVEVENHSEELFLLTRLESERPKPCRSHRRNRIRGFSLGRLHAKRSNMEVFMTEIRKRVPRRIAQTVIGSLKGGVVPRIGLPYITVGRKNEIEALLHDVDIITEGGASFRFIVGRYGSGKSFLIQTIRNYVMDRGFIVADADLSPERRLMGTKGQGLATYRELISNLSTKTKPEGGALTLVLDRWISNVQIEAAQETGLMPGDPMLTRAVDQKIYAVTAAVSEMVHGFEFARLLSSYYHAYVDWRDMPD